MVSGMNAGIVVDYSLSTEENIVQMIAGVIRAEGNLDILSLISRREDLDKNLDLPSWASLCTWDERNAHALPLLADSEDDNTQRPFDSSARASTVSFEMAGEMVVNAWYVGTLEQAGRCRHAEATFQSAGYERYIAERRIFKTQDDLQCLAPLEAEVGDEAYIFAGGRTPYVLNRREGEYRLVGECLVLGLMHGEYFDGAGRNARPQRIYIV